MKKIIFITIFLLGGLFFTNHSDAALLTSCTSSRASTSTGSYAVTFDKTLPYSVGTVAVYVRTPSSATFHLVMREQNNGGTIIATSTTAGIGLQGSYSTFALYYMNFDNIAISSSTMHYGLIVDSGTLEHYNTVSAGCTNTNSVAAQEGEFYFYDDQVNPAFGASLSFILPESNDDIATNKVNLMYEVDDLDVDTSYTINFSAEVTSSTSALAPQYSVFKTFRQEDGSINIGGRTLLGGFTEFSTDEDYLLLNKSVYDITMWLCRSSDIPFSQTCLSETHTNIEILGEENIENIIANYNYPIVCVNGNCTDSAGNYSSSTENWACIGGTMFNFNMGICFGSAIESVTNFFIYPHDWSKDYFQTSVNVAQTTFPFNVFFDFENIVSTQVSTSTPSRDLQMVYGGHTVNVLTSSTLSSIFGATTTAKIMSFERNLIWGLTGLLILAIVI